MSLLRSRTFREVSRGLGRRRRQGMSLIEIMVVIAIIGILMTVLAVGITARLDDANVSTTEIQIDKLKEGLQLYALKHNQKYPSTSEGLAAAKKYFSESGDEIPKDAWGNDFLYFSPGTHGDHPYEIISLGKDGKEGGEDANADLVSWKKSGE